MFIYLIGAVGLLAGLAVGFWHVRGKSLKTPRDRLMAMIPVFLGIVVGLIALAGGGKFLSFETSLNIALFAIPFVVGAIIPVMHNSSVVR